MFLLTSALLFLYVVINTVDFFCDFFFAKVVLFIHFNVLRFSISHTQRIILHILQRNKKRTTFSLHILAKLIQRLSVCLFVTGCGTQGLFSLSEHCVAWGGGLPRSVVLLLSTVIRFMSLPSLWGEGGAV